MPAAWPWARRGGEMACHPPPVAPRSAAAAGGARSPSPPGGTTTHPGGEFARCRVLQLRGHLLGVGGGQRHGDKDRSHNRGLRRGPAPRSPGASEGLWSPKGIGRVGVGGGGGHLQPPPLAKRLHGIALPVPGTTPGYRNRHRNRYHRPTEPPAPSPGWGAAGAARCGGAGAGAGPGGRRAEGEEDGEEHPGRPPRQRLNFALSREAGRAPGLGGAGPAGPGPGCMQRRRRRGP